MTLRSLLLVAVLIALGGAQAGAGTIVSNPSLVWSTYFGGSGYEMTLGAAVDSGGNMFITGRTESANLPTTTDAVSKAYGGGASDAFVAKFGPGGNLLYATYLGGSGEDEGRGIAVDAVGNVYVNGLTRSTDFPTANAFDPSFNGEIDAYVAKISHTGALAWSTYFGGGGDDKGLALTLDGAGNTYVTGEAGPGFPATAGALDTSQNGDIDGYVAKFTATGTLGYSTFLGSPGFDDGLAIAVDGASNAFVTGKASAGFSTTPGAFDTTPNGGFDMFVTKLSPSGSALLYSTYLGGNAWDEGLGIGVTAAGEAVVAGNVQSPNFPTTPGAYDTTLDGTVDTAVTKLNPSGSGLVYSMLLGKSGWTEGDGLALDQSGNAYVSGHGESPNLPTTAGALQRSPGGDVDGFLFKIDPTGTSLLYSTYIGGSGWDAALTLTAGGNGIAYVTGGSTSNNYPVTAGAFATNGSGGFDATATAIKTTTPTAVYLASFNARAGIRGVTVTWRTASETSTLGFNVWRDGTDGRRRINPMFIVAGHAGESIGGTYRLLDTAVRAGRTYTYRLQVVYGTGQRTWLGATQVLVSSGLP